MIRITLPPESARCKRLVIKRWQKARYAAGKGCGFPRDHVPTS
jgi:hypothetical protein